MQPITYFNRYTGCLEQEAVYGEGFLKWAYGRAVGRATVELLVKNVCRGILLRFHLGLGSVHLFDALILLSSNTDPKASDTLPAHRCASSAITKSKSLVS